MSDGADQKAKKKARTELHEKTLTTASVLFALASQLHGARRHVWSTEVRRMAERLRDMGAVVAEEGTETGR